MQSETLIYCRLKPSFQMTSNTALFLKFPFSDDLYTSDEQAV
ncbi:hypothetical protein [Neisseria cinerea]|nr:hypothetical protein [Neisseria cinerea]